MIEKKTEINQIEITPNGSIQVRFALLLAEGTEVLSRAWHRTAFTPGCDIDSQVGAVNAHLSAIGFPSVPAPAVVQIKDHANIAWTAQAVAAYMDAVSKL